MNNFNIEIKARCTEHQKIKELIMLNNGTRKGIKTQIDTYFHSNCGRLKLREEENNCYLIYYKRENTYGPKESLYNYFSFKKNDELKQVLTSSMGVLVVVSKTREIFSIGNVEFHLDTVNELGNFIEIEVISNDDSSTPDKLMEKCKYFLNLFEISDKDFVSCSYSDMLIEKLGLAK